MFSKYLFPVIFLVLISCSNDRNHDKQFTKLKSSHTGIYFKNLLKDNPLTRDNILAFDYFNNGSGVAIGDLNNDGMSDIVFGSNHGEDKIYINKGEMQFDDISKKSNLASLQGWSLGVTLVDINNDGWLDIYICRAGPSLNKKGRKNILLINNKNETFSEKANLYGLDDDKLSSQAVFFDYNKDGLLDCYVMNESNYARVGFSKIFEEIKIEQKLRDASGTLYQNTGKGFVDVSKEAGILQFGYGLGLFVSDFNGDSYPDIYVANDYSVPDFMWINQRNGTFKDEIKKRTEQTSWFSMGIDIADINNDGHLDIGVVDMSSNDHVLGKTLMAPMNPKLFDYVTNELGYQRQHMYNVLQLNNGNGRFSNVAGAANVLSSEWSWAALFADLDNDGDKDYFVCNGYYKCHRDNDFQIYLKSVKAKHNNDVPYELRTDLYSKIPSYKTVNKLYVNQGDLEFVESAKEWGLEDLSFSNGAAYGDLDNDGDLDLVVNNINEEAFIYKNNTSNNYLRIELVSPLDKQGTKVWIYSKDSLQLQEYSPVRGYFSRVEDYLHFGLGNKTSVDSIRVEWPDRSFQKLENVKANQLLKLDRSKASLPGKNKGMNYRPFFSKSSSIFDFKHIENNYNDYNQEVLVPYRQSTLGPYLTIGDVNGDKKDDLFIGGAHGQGGKLFIQKENNIWENKSQTTFEDDKLCEDMKSTFFDFDNDNDLDLYVVSGGNEFSFNHPSLSDRLYINDGSGNFLKSVNLIPDDRISGMQVAASDYDNDGDQDLFLSGRIIPQRYPLSATSTLLRNDSGIFVDIKNELDSSLVHAGIINDAIWIDIDTDSDEDLIICGEWNTIKIFENQEGSLVSVKNNLHNCNGWWYTLKAFDIENDGDLDFIAGNLGKNSKFKADSKKPLYVYANDFDETGTHDIVLAKPYKDKIVPVRGRQCSSEQMPFIADKFKSYASFANASISEILGEKKLGESAKYLTDCFESALFINNGSGQFSKKILPIQAQLFPIIGIEAIDVNNDGFKDIILSGNLYDMEIETPRLDAGRGLLLLNDSKGELIPVDANHSGIYCSGNLRNVKSINLDNGHSMLAFAMNNDSITTFILEK